MNWTEDFCTVCDKQCQPGYVYCSEECRQADEAAGSRANPPVSPRVETVRALEQATAVSQFMYTSPMLLPQNDEETAAGSPPLSPLLIATDCASVDKLQSSTNYRRWLSQPS